jgi:hypothetical protein
VTRLSSNSDLIARSEYICNVSQHRMEALCGITRETTRYQNATKDKWNFNLDTPTFFDIVLLGHSRLSAEGQVQPRAIVKGRGRRTSTFALPFASSHMLRPPPCLVPLIFRLLQRLVQLGLFPPGMPKRRSGAAVGLSCCSHPLDAAAHLRAPV